MRNFTQNKLFLSDASHGPGPHHLKGSKAAVTDVALWRGKGARVNILSVFRETGKEKKKE